MSKFSGTWVDEAHDRIEVTSDARILTVTFRGPRGTFTGSDLDLSNPVIYVNFSDIRPETGVLSNDGNTIYWGAGSKWVRA